MASSVEWSGNKQLIYSYIEDFLSTFDSFPVYLILSNEGASSLSPDTSTKVYSK